jgi:hypothetical protein
MSKKTKRRKTKGNSFISIYNYSDFIFRTALENTVSYFQMTS